MKFKIVPNGFDAYQREALETAVFPKENWKEYLGAGLAAEAGEVAGKIAKVFRGDKALDPAAIAKELGDVQWFIAVLAHYLGYDLSEIAADNIENLRGRKERGTLKGDGDNR